KAVVPDVDLRKVPRLSNRAGPLKEPELCASNSAPSRFVISPPVRFKSPTPVQTVVPASSSVRKMKRPGNGADRASIKHAPPVSTIVGPVPINVPDDNKRVPGTVSVPLPVSVGEVPAPPMLTFAHSASVSKVTAQLIWMRTLSFEPGTRLGDQFEALFQSPPL